MVEKLDITERKGRGKAVPLQVWSGPEGSGKLRFPDFMTTAQDSGKVVSLTNRPHLPPGKVLELYTLHVSDGLSVHHQDFKTVHTASGICHASRQPPKPA